MARDKVYISAERLEKDCWAFARQIYTAGFDFDLFLGITRGGAQICFYMQEVFAVLSGTKKEYAVVRARSYTGIGEAEGVAVDLPHDLKPEAGTRILVCDDIFDRGETLSAVKQTIENRIVAPNVSVRIAALYYKPDNRRVEVEPDFHYQAFSNDHWVVFPHELLGLSEKERTQKGFFEDKTFYGTAHD